MQNDSAKLDAGELIRSPHLDIIRESLGFIESNLNNDLDLPKLTERLNNSHWYFQRLFRSIIGISVGQYIRERKLSEAAKQIRTGGVRLIDVAMEYGFESHESFSRAFKKFFGVTASQVKSGSQVVLREHRNAISEAKLNHFLSHVQREPDIIEIPIRQIAGTQIKYPSHFVESNVCNAQITKHWCEFIVIKKAIPNRLHKELFGIILSGDEQLREENLTYISGVEVTGVDKKIEGITYMSIPAGTYARFVNRGCEFHTRHLVDYVYGIWLPTSPYVRAPGPDIEVFDKRYNQGDPSSIYNFLIPIRQK